jgi:rod shape determining protein RodA
MAVLAALAFPVIWPHLDEYRRMRILVGFNPSIDPTNYGYQQLRSMDAIAAGGVFGEGMFGGAKYRLVPTFWTDFIFAVIAEKFGLFGCIILFALLLLLVLRIFLVARRAGNDYATFICAGVAAIITAQSIENMGMCLGMLPVIGITLPFVSYGGSSVLSMYLLIGLIQSVYSHKDRIYQGI